MRLFQAAVWVWPGINHPASSSANRKDPITPVSPHIYLRANRLGVMRALYRCRAVAVGPHALREAVLYLLRAGVVSATDYVNVTRQKTYIGALTVASIAGTIA